MEKKLAAHFVRRELSLSLSCLMRTLSLINQPSYLIAMQRLEVKKCQQHFFPESSGSNQISLLQR